MKISVAVCIAFLAGPALAQSAPERDLAKVEGGRFVLDKTHARLVFSTTHFGFSTYYALFSDFDARLDFDPKAPEKSSLSVTVNLKAITAADAKLEKNLRSESFFDVAKYPTATFTSTRIEMTGDGQGRVTGDLSLHGVTKSVTLDVTFNGGGKSPLTGAYVLGFDAKGTLNRSDFGIKNFVPLVGDTVTLAISCEFDRVKPEGGD